MGQDVDYQVTLRDLGLCHEEVKVKLLVNSEELCVSNIVT